MLIDFTQPYLTTQLIAYIGNKRKLLVRLSDAFDELEEHSRITTFIDPFAGSGSVSRLAKVRGYRVFANDWEPFAYVVNAAHLAIDPPRCRELFCRTGGIEATIAAINESRSETDGVFCRLYAPASTENADPANERLFYTRENAEFLDGVRTEIERRYSGWDLDADQYQEKLLLLSSLVYEAATHANTSGVFKAYYKGFGGYGRDALRRIMSPMRLEIPELHSGLESCVSCEDASSFVSRITADLCYLDPPYNQHQYGSNYHMLNTVVLGDEPPLKDPSSKAGIRSDWSKTWSRFCTRRTAGDAFRELLASIDARFIVLSYNSEGTCDIEELFDMLAAQGTVRILTDSYVKFRGGRQSIARKNHNQELIFILDRQSEIEASSLEDLRRKVGIREISALLSAPLNPQKMAESFEIDNGYVLLCDSSPRLQFPAEQLLLRMPVDFASDLHVLSTVALQSLKAKLASCSIHDRSEEVEFLCSAIDGDLPVEAVPQAIEQLLSSLKKFAYAKYRREFESTVIRVLKVARGNPDRFPGVEAGVSDIVAIAQKRFGD